jgi:hypothetical protein
MIRIVRVLLCDEEHGTGDVIFPEDLQGELRDCQTYSPATAAEIRRDARKAGWRRKGGRDLCPGCAECEGI